MSGKRRKNRGDWSEAQRRCGLTDADVHMAKELGFKPVALIRNIPTKSQPWKLPVKLWIHHLYAERFCDAPAPDAEPDEDGVDMVGEDELLAQWDTVNEQPCFTHPHDGRVFSLEEAGRYMMQRDPQKPSLPADARSDPRVAEAEPYARRRRREFRLAAEAVAAAMAALPEVRRIALFGSVAPAPGIASASGSESGSASSPEGNGELTSTSQHQRSAEHECKDVDLAVWISDLTNLKTLQKARTDALKMLLAERNIGVAHHQVDVFLLEPGTDRYLGRLCCFNACPKGKPECDVPGCGAEPFLRQHAGFAFDWCDASRGAVLLYDRATARFGGG